MPRLELLSCWKLSVALNIMLIFFFFFFVFPSGKLSVCVQESERTRSEPGKRSRDWAPAHVTDCPVVFSRLRIPVAGRIS